MKSILLIIPNLNIGGAEINILRLAKFLSKKNNVSLVILGNVSEYFTKDIKTLKVNIFNSQNIFYSIFKLYSFLKKNNFDNVVSFLNISILASLIANALLMKKHKINISFRNIISAYFYASLKDKVIILLIRLLLPYANKVIFNSNYAADEAHKKFFFPKKKSLVIFNPLSSSDIKKIRKNQDNAFEIKNYFCCVGSLTKQKNFLSVIKAFEKINNLEDIKLVIVGEGEEKKNLLNYTQKKKMTDKVIFLGEVKNPFHIMSNAKALISSSLWEGLPNVIIEAVLLNKYVIASDCPGGTKEILNGYNRYTIYKNNDVKNLASKMMYVLKLQEKNIEIKNNTEILKKLDEHNFEKFL